MTKIRTIRITLDIDLASLPRADWEEEIEAMRDDEGNSDLDEASDDWPLEELSTNEVANCVEQATYDPEMFAGSMLYLKVAGTRIVSHEFVGEGSGEGTKGDASWSESFTRDPELELDKYIDKEFLK